MRFINVLTVMLTAAMLCVSAGAAMIDVPGSTADTTIGLNASGVPGVHYIGSTSLLIGDDNAAYGKDDVAAVLVFVLPDLQGEAIDTASLSFSIKWPKYAVSGGVDVYALRTDASSSVLSSDYGWGEPLVPAGNGALIQDDIVVHNGENQDYMVVDTDVAADALLAGWLTAAYDGGAAAGDYVFFRLNGDAQSANAFAVASAENASEEIPMLSIQTVPEPASLAVLALGAMAALRPKR